MLLVLLAALLAVGCTRVVDGTVRPAAGLVPEALAGRTVKEVLLDEADLSKMFDLPFESSAEFPPLYGGADDLPDGWASASPPECVGAAVGMQKTVYGSHDVRDVAQEYWRANGSSGLMVKEGLVTVDAAADADTLFDEFARQWEQCDGVTVHRNDRGQADTTGAIGDVTLTDSVVSASVRSAVSGVAGMMVARALGVRVNCVVDVEILYFASSSAGSKDPATMATEVARALMAKVSALS